MERLLSVIIPARNEKYLQNTIDDLILKAVEPIEIIVILDGYWPDPAITDHPAVTIIHHTDAMGMRPSINEGARAASGQYLMKCDAHCCFGPGFDKILKDNCKPDWTMVPRRYNLDIKKYDRGDKIFDFQYISHPSDKKYPLRGNDWPEYANRVMGRKNVDLMTSQGSCWFMYKQRFFDLGCLDDINYGTMGREAQETCLKAWLSGGKYILCRKTWYAHWKKGATKGHPERATYKKPMKEWRKSSSFLIKQFYNELPKWEHQTRSLEWLIKKFKPVPTWHDLDASLASRYIREKFKLNNEAGPVIKLKGVGRHVLYELFQGLGFKLGAEIGVWRGQNAQRMFMAMPGLQLVGVDPYLNHQYVRKARSHGVMEKAHKMALSRLKGANITWINKRSEIAAEEVADESLDFVYIDAEHTYDSAMLDIILWNRKVKSGGIIAGHDYFNNDKLGLGVKQAVNDYTKWHKIAPLYITDRSADLDSRMERSKKPSWMFVKT